MVMGSGRSALPVMTEAIAGRRLSGSWWKEGAPGTYRILGVLERSQLLSVPLVEGKGTFLDPSLGPAIERIASDPERGRAARRTLTATARALLERAEGEGEVRMDRWRVPTPRARPARKLLERELLVWSFDIHTERGYHTAIVRPWGTSEAARRFRKAARSLTFEEAVDDLLLAALRSAVVAPEREARRWLVSGAERLDALIGEGRVERISADFTWLTVHAGPHKNRARSVS